MLEVWLNPIPDTTRSENFTLGAVLESYKSFHVLADISKLLFPTDQHKGQFALAI